MMAAPRPQGSVWQRFWDDQRRLPYWYNNATGASTWEEPAECRGPPPAASHPPAAGGGGPYRPPAAGSPAGPRGAPSYGHTNSGAAPYGQHSAPGPYGSGRPQGALVPVADTQQQSGEWERHRDEASGNDYMYNTRTGETRWDDGRPPPGQQPQQQQQQRQAGTMVVARSNRPVRPDITGQPRTMASVQQWNDDKGYGFLSLDDGRRAYVHRTSIISPPVVGPDGAPTTNALTTGEDVSCVAVPDPRDPSKWSAFDIRRGSPATVTQWDHGKGFGFIQFEQRGPVAGRRAYVHRSKLAFGQSRDEGLQVGERVTAVACPDPRDPSKLTALDVHRV
eukprot:TRINITY_DN1206_c0_g1_i1.p2 TRINITY_DN1206_c0_g1~~TRINITY_DN1206_c0_g1_i1.p2  ORF type:complete len:358 (+),score=58.29 TRINITY_DN1206_c0_g1_i1:71-1075(+)